MIELNFIKDNKQINLKANICDNEILSKYMKFEYFTKLCKEGCPNYNTNYTCPPHSPTFTEHTKDYKSSLVIAMYININKAENMEEVHNYLRGILSDLLINLEKKVDGLLTEGGRCLKCNICTYEENLPCRFPKDMRFSMEAMGIDLSNLSKDILNHSMMWSGDENTYCTVIGSINFNDVKEEEFEKLINEKIKL